jgi:hypothetical protein
MPAQDQQIPEGIIERVEKAHENDEPLAGYKKDVPNLYTFCIYKLCIEEIFNMLTGEKPREFPIDSLIEYETDLDKISGGFYKLYGKLKNLSRDPTQKLINEAGTHLSTAIDDRRKGEMQNYLRHYKKCYDYLFSLNEHLNAVLFTLNNETKP